MTVRQAWLWRGPWHMTGDYGSRPDPRSWTRPSFEASPSAARHASPSSWSGTGNGVMAEVRERVRALETLVPLLEQMASERTAAQVKRTDGVEQRLGAQDLRMDRLDQRLTSAGHTGSTAVPSDPATKQSLVQLAGNGG